MVVNGRITESKSSLFEKTFSLSHTLSLTLRFPWKVLREGDFFLKVINEMKQFHPWYIPFFGDSHTQTRIQHGLVLLSSMFTVLFTTSIVYSLTESGDCFANKLER